MTRAGTFGFVAFTVVAAIFSSATPSAAYYEGPWCMKSIAGRAEVNICHFRTIEHCLAERSFWGSAAFCVQNPRYLPYWTGREPRRRSAR